MWLFYVMSTYGIRPRGVVHLGAHHAEELSIYQHHGVPTDKIVWVEANPDMVERIRTSLPSGSKVVHAAVTDSNKKVTFHVTNNSVSSSMLPLGTHAADHPGVVYVKDVEVEGKTLPQIFEENNLHTADYDFLLMDIQGGEGCALQGMGDFIKNFKHVVTEFCETEQYVGATLWDDLKGMIEAKGFRFVERRVFPDRAGDALFERID